MLVVLDDDPTGTQSVSDLPVLLRWEESDFRWAFAPRAGRAPAAVYVLTNTRSLDAAEVEARNREAVIQALAAAEATGTTLGFVSRSDPTLRGQYPLETDAVAATLHERIGQTVDGVVIVLAFPDAGRITIGGVHYVRANDTLTPVSETEFARDATFGYRHSDLAGYVEERSAGSFTAADVIVLDLNTVRGPSGGIADALAAATDSTPIVVDIVTENDLRSRALGLAEAESRGKRLLYRVGPPFVRARIGQDEHDSAHTWSCGSRRCTSRLLVRTGDPVENLRTARTISTAVVDVVRHALAAHRPRFVIAKGGITASDVAARGLGIRHAMVRGSMLPGIVSPWEPMDGPAQCIPHIVFAGNVGDERSLLDVVRKLSTTL